MKRFCLILFSAFLLPLQSHAAACCGGGFAAPALIVGDDLATFTASYGYSEVKKEVGADTYWHELNTTEAAETVRLDAARVFLDRWQAGLSLPIVRRSKAGNSSTGAGDLAASLGYEYLPDWDYNPWRPRGLGFLQLVAPTGRSIDEASAAYQLDSRGRGYWSVGLGIILTKAWGSWDAYASLDAHRSLARNFRNAQFQGRLHPGYGGNAGAGGGWNFAAIRLGASLTWTYEDPVAASGTINSRGAPQRYATAALAASYLLSPAWASTLTYSDQTLFGSPVNAALGRGVSLMIQRRWPR